MARGDSMIASLAFTRSSLAFSAAAPPLANACWPPLPSNIALEVWSVTGAASPTRAALYRSVGINAHRARPGAAGEIINHAQPEHGGLPGAPLAEADIIKGF